MYLINIFDSDLIFYILLAILACISLAMFYLIYSQNKDGVVDNKKKSQLQKVESTDDVLEEKVEKKSKVDWYNFKEEEAKPKLIEPTEMPIPNQLEYTQSIFLSDIEDLQNISKELETLPRERTVKMTPYEEEQEEKAIISYEELLSKTSDINITQSVVDEEPVVEEEPRKEEVVSEVPPKKSVVEPMPSKKVETKPLPEVKREFGATEYDHEESFLNDLKQLQENLN